MMKESNFVDLVKATKNKNGVSSVSGGTRIVKANHYDPQRVQLFSHLLAEDDGPHIKLKKKNDVVELIEVNCTCGREMQIFLDYGDALGGGRKSNSQSKE